MATPTPLSRPAAIAQGAKLYYNGKSCAKGHEAYRYVSTGGCTECSKAATTAWRGKLQERLRARPLDPKTGALLTGRAHPDDHEDIYALMDYLNQQRGLAPTPRPGAQPDVAPVAPPPDTRTDWERQYEIRLNILGSPAAAHSVATLLAGPETHSPGWAWPAGGGPRTPDQEALLEQLAPDTYNGGGAPRWPPES